MNEQPSESRPGAVADAVSVDGDFTPSQLEACLELALELKSADRGRVAHPSARGRHIALLFEKPSLRTRSTFQIAVRELGGDVIEPPQDVALGGRETIKDVARNLERWVHGAVVRTYARSRIEAFAAAAPRLRVVNALTDEEHPCQALADCLTMREKWGIAPRTDDCVCRRQQQRRALAGAGGDHARRKSPDRVAAGYELDAAARAAISRNARHGGSLQVTNDPVAAVTGAEAVYTDVWASMGQESETAQRHEIFVPFQVNGELMAHAAEGALFMHCLPAHRGDEVTDEVIDSDASVVFDQSENRLHTQKALLAMLA